MKIRLGIHEANLDGYINLDPVPLEGPAFVGSIIDLSGICSESECLELLAPSVLDYIPGPLIDQALEHWVKLLRKSGKIILGGTDYLEVARNTPFLGTVSFNELVYGNPIKKQGMFSLSEVVDKLKSLGLKIMSQKLQNNKFVVSAVRP